MEDGQIMEVRTLLEAPALRAGNPDPDAALVAAAREEPQAFLALYDRYFERVLGYVRLRIRDEAACEDVTSTVFTTALGQLWRFRGDGTFAGWLFQIARNAVGTSSGDRPRPRFQSRQARPSRTSRSGFSRTNGRRTCMH